MDGRMEGWMDRERDTGRWIDKETYRQKDSLKDR